ncbi:hypothetical protein WN943_010718 [Citrus x changshan-huyou]
MHADKNDEWPATDGDPPTEMNKDSIEIDTKTEEEAENEVNVDSNESALGRIETVDVLGREFTTDEDADSFYCKYAKEMGFGVRRHNKRWKTKGVLIGRKWVCSREGYRPKKFLCQDNRIREARPLPRTGYQAAFKIKRNDENTAWICTQFSAGHNHTLTPPQYVYYIRSHRKVSGADLVAASSLHKVGMKPSQIHEYMVERLMDRQRDVEGNDDYDSVDGRPVLRTHLKAYEGQVGDIYTRAIFRIITNQITKEGIMTTKQVSNDDVVENIRTIPNCVILGRWTKNAKTGVSPHKKKEKSNSPYMSMEARLGSLHAACRNLQRLAASSCATFELAITDAHNLSLRLEALICDKDKDTLEGQLGRRSHVQDPTVVLTKGCRKKKKTGSSPERRCSGCGQPGHTIRK